MKNTVNLIEKKNEKKILARALIVWLLPITLKRNSDNFVISIIRIQIKNFLFFNNWTTYGQTQEVGMFIKFTNILAALKAEILSYYNYKILNGPSIKLYKH